MGRKKWSEIKAAAAPETIAAAAEQTEHIITSLRLRELRELRGLTQTDIADRLEIRQVSVSKMEARSDVRVSTLRSVLEAMGGTLDIRARFPDAEYRLEFGHDAQITGISPLVATVTRTVEVDKETSDRRWDRYRQSRRVRGWAGVASARNAGAETVQIAFANR